METNNINYIVQTLESIKQSVDTHNQISYYFMLANDAMLPIDEREQYHNKALELLSVLNVVQAKQNENDLPGGIIR